jgi:restriction system protein
MKWKMSENSLFAILLRSSWWLSAAIAAALVAISLGMFPGDFKFYGAFGAAPFVVIAGIAAWKQLKAPSAARIDRTLEAVRAMSWGDFASAVENAYRRDGYEVSRLRGDAAEFEMTRSGRTALVSCKRWKVVRTGVEPLRDLHAAKEAREAHEGIYIVAGELSDNARRYAAENKIRLVGGAELVQLMPDVGRASKRSPGQPKRSRAVL